MPTPRQRTLQALAHRPTDIVPYQIEFTQQSHDKVAAYLSDPAFDAAWGNHITTAYYAGDPAELPGQSERFRDDFGVVWNRSGADKDIGVVEHRVLQTPDLAAVHLPAVPVEKLKSLCEAALRTAGDRFTLASLGFSLFERAWTLTGMEDLLVYMISDPEFVHALFDEILRFNLEVLDVFLAYPFDGIYFGDDWGQQHGLIMGPTHWRAFIKPRLAQMYAKVKGTGRLVFQHSCGDIGQLFPDLIDLGLDVYQTFQPEIYNIAAVKAEYGQHLSFWGGISTQTLLPTASPERVAQVTRETIAILGASGGCIAGPTHAIPGDVPPENILAMAQVLMNQEITH
jgi:uroporphyrinogen decarboxylase